MVCRAYDVCLGTKIRILKQITTARSSTSVEPGCLSWHKDTNFKANHNCPILVGIMLTDVCLGTKIRILKQITTGTGRLVDVVKMFVLAQRYEF